MPMLGSKKREREKGPYVNSAGLLCTTMLCEDKDRYSNGEGKQ